VIKEQVLEWLRSGSEGAEDIANNEWGKIAQETARHFSISCLSASHRVGTLEVGEIAVWIGVASPHRRTARLVRAYTNIHTLNGN